MSIKQCLLPTMSFDPELLKGFEIFDLKKKKNKTKQTKRKTNSLQKMARYNICSFSLAFSG